MKKNKKAIAVLLFSSMLLMTAGCGQRDEEEIKTFLVQEEGEEAYSTVAVSYDEVVKHATISCKYSSTHTEHLSFPVGEKLIEKVHVKSGDYVTKGQLLAELEVEDLELSIAEQEYAVEHLEMEIRQKEELKEFDLENAEIMYQDYSRQTKEDREHLKEQKEAIEKQYQTDLENLSDSLAISKKRLEQSRKEWNQGRLFASITGQITYMMNPLEDTYSIKDETIITISDLDACYFLADDKEYAEYFREDTPVTVVYKNAGVEYSCEAYPVDMDQWQLQMRFKPQLDEAIENGLNGKITIELGRRENVLCVPKDCVHESDQGPFVYLDKDGLLEMRYVKVGLLGDTLTEITDGLLEGETVALTR